jgi:hypothetical protein
MGLQPAEGHLDRVQVGGIFGQIAKRRTARFDGLADTGGPVRWKIVDHHNLVPLEGRRPSQGGRSQVRGLASCLLAICCILAAGPVLARELASLVAANCLRAVHYCSLSPHLRNLLDCDIAVVAYPARDFRSDLDPGVGCGTDN